jgi:hypothetical protein
MHGIALLREGLANLGESDENAAERYELLLHLGIALSAEDTDQAIGFYKKSPSASFGRPSWPWRQAEFGRPAAPDQQDR